jgi:hypothetical protein
MLADGPLYIIEGEKKALLMAQLGFPAIGIAGVEGWHARGSRTLLPDFDVIPLKGRLIELLPDGDYQQNLNVRRAVKRFADTLCQAGARPRLMRLPATTHGKTGIDDYLMAITAEAR